MRLEQFEINAIKMLAQKYFGPATGVYLFGSRVDDSKKGGDIDLLIKNDNEENLTLENKIDFLVDLKLIIGNRKIDVVLDNSYAHKKKDFYSTILKSAIKL